MDSFNFTPINGFEDSVSFPDPSSEEEAREQLMTPLNQLKTYVNSMADAITTLEGTFGDQEAFDTLVAQIQSVQALLNQPIAMLVEE